MVAGHHDFMDNTKRIPLVWNAKENTELLRNTDKNRSVSVPEFDNAYRNEITANEIGKRCLSRETLLHSELTHEQQRLHPNAGIKLKRFRNLFYVQTMKGN
jgi:hypothetical protein